MSKRKTAEEIIKEKFKTPPSQGYNPVLEAIREGMRQERDAALEWAAEQARIEVIRKEGWNTAYRVNKETILSGKTSPELEII